MRKLLLVTGSLAVILLAGAAPAPAQTTRPALAQLDAEIRSLYADVAAGTVHVHLPMPALIRLLGPDAHPLGKWSEVVDASVWRRMQELAATRPVGAGSILDDPHGPVAAGGESKAVLYLDEITDRMTVVLPRQAAGQGEFLGVILEGGQHVAIPAYLTREELGERPLRVTAGEAHVEATFVGSDRQTHVTVVKLARPCGKPLAAAGAKPPAGALVLMLPPGRRAPALRVWTGAPAEPAVLVDMSSRLAGFARPGQLLSGDDLRFVADQIIRHGRVQRAQLGAMIGQVHPSDPLRQQVPLLGERPALQVTRIAPGSAAAAAGLRAGDLILSLAGEPVEDLSTFAADISAHRGPTDLTLLRDGAEVTITVDLQPK